MQSSLYASYRTVEENKTVVKTIPSYEIAEMMDRKHSEVLRMLEGSKEIIGIIPTLENAELVSQDYFIESTYKVEGNNKSYKCYECTKIGCDLLANKMTGEKGILFTAKYVKRFNQMEQAIKKEVKQLSALELLELQFKAIKEQDHKIEAVKNDFEDFKGDIPLFQTECKELQKEVRKMGIKVLGGYKSPAYKDNSLRAKVYSDIQTQIRREFDVCRYESIKRRELNRALELIEDYKVPYKLEQDIRLKNMQLHLVVNE